MVWTKRLTMAAAGLAAVMLASSAQAVTINFGAIPIGGTPSYTGATLDQSTSFNFGGGFYLVNQIGPGDQSTLALNNLIALTNPIYGPGNIGALAVPMIKVWVTAAGTFTETLTNFLINRTTPDALTLVLSGTLTSTTGINQSAFAIVNANQVGGPGSAVNWSLTNTSSLVPSNVPLPAGLPLFVTGLGAIGLLAWRRKRKAIAA